MSSNFNVNDIMSIDAHTLAQTQFKALQSHALEIVDKLKLAIEKCDLDLVPIFESPAGDGYGKDNLCINFSYNEEEMDINDLMNKLAELKLMWYSGIADGIVEDLKNEV